MAWAKQMYAYEQSIKVPSESGDFWVSVDRVNYSLGPVNQFTIANKYAKKH